MQEDIFIIEYLYALKIVFSNFTKVSNVFNSIYVKSIKTIILNDQPLDLLINFP